MSSCSTEQGLFTSVLNTTALCAQKTGTVYFSTKYYRTVYIKEGFRVLFLTINDKILYFPSCTVTNILHIYSNIIHLGMVVVNRITRIMMRVLHAWGTLNRGLLTTNK